MVQLSYVNANARLTLDMSSRVLTTRRDYLQMAESSVPRKRRFLKPRNTRKLPIDGKLRCSHCGEWKNATPEFFHKSKYKASGFKSFCKTCVSATRKPYISTPELLAKKRAASKTPKARATATKNRRRKEATPEYREKRREQSNTPEAKAKVRERSARPEVRERQRAHDREYGKQYRQTQKYKETRKSINARRREDPKFKAQMKVAYQKRQARKLELPDTLTTEQWQFALDYFNGCCAVCGRPLKDLFGTHTASIDHWIPLSNPECLGTTADNCIPLCHGFDGCNGSKNYRDPVEWLNGKFGKRKAKKILERINAYFDMIRDRDVAA